MPLISEFCNRVMRVSATLRLNSTVGGHSSEVIKYALIMYGT